MRSGTLSKDIRIIAVGFVLSMAVCCLIFTDLFWEHRVRFMGHQDTENPYENVFILISHFFQGGIQLFDRFDGMNFAYAHLTSGFYTVSNILTAVVYILLFPLYQDPGQAFHVIFSVVFYSVNILIRCVGGYVLLRKYNISAPAIVVSLIILNTFLSVSMHFGLLTNNLYSYFPLLAYFILNFFERYRLKDFICAVLLLTICVANSSFFALSYFYQNVHFLIVCAAVYGVLFHRRNISLVKGWNWQNVQKLLVAAGLIILIMAPWVMMSKSMAQDFHIANSGFGSTQGRVQNAFHPDKYFKPKGETMVSPGELPLKMFEFTNNFWDKSWVFMGVLCLGLAVAGMLCFHHKVKYVFAAVILLILSTNLPYTAVLPLSAGHWINALTNPFSFLLRTFHMPVLLMPYVLFPLIAFGVHVVWQHIRVDRDRCSVFRTTCLRIAWIGFIFWVAWSLENPIKNYVLASAVILLGLFQVMSSRDFVFGGISRSQWIYVLFIAVCAVDGAALKKFYDINQNQGVFFTEDDGLHLKPRVYAPVDAARPMILDYQNPSVLPLREYVRVQSIDVRPRLVTPQNHYGSFYKYNALERYFLKPDVYQPRPAAYKDMERDSVIKQILMMDERMFMLSLGGAHGPAQDLGRTTQEHLLKFSKARKVKKKEIDQYQWPLPKSFPAYMASSVFTADSQLISVTVGDYELFPVQGALIHPMSFDAGHIQRNALTIALPHGFKHPDQVSLKVRRSNELLDVRKNTDDALGITFLASEEGLFKSRLPYDSKWKVYVNGKGTDIVKVDGYFLGFPLNAGTHQIMMQYWPGSPLRWMIPLSVLLTMVVFVWVTWQGIKQSGTAVEQR